MPQLTPNFSLEELVHSDTAIAHHIDNTPSDAIKANLLRLAHKLEEIRAVLDRPISINSGYRCKKLNDAVHGVPDSAHLFGLAADIECSLFGVPLAVCRKLEPLVADLDLDQLIYEHPVGSWTHIGLRADATQRHELWTIAPGNVTTAGIVD